MTCAMCIATPVGSGHKSNVVRSCSASTVLAVPALCEVLTVPTHDVNEVWELNSF